VAGTMIKASPDISASLTEIWLLTVCRESVID
jgi:hypothetical protein